MPDNYRTRQIIIISIVLLFVLLLGYAFYRLIASRGSGLIPARSPQAPVGGSIGQSPVPLASQEGSQITPLPSPIAGLEGKIKEETLVALTDFSIISPVINKSQDKILLYKKDGGNIYSVDLSGIHIQQKLSNITIVGLADAIWSPAKDRAGVFYIDGELLKSFLHIGTSSVISLPLDIKSFAWSPDGKQFAYLTENNNGLSLFISNSSAKSVREAFKTPLLDAQITWISADKIAFQTAPSGNANGFVFVYSITSGSFRKILGPLFGLTTLWSPDASHILVGSTNSAGNQYALSLYDASGAQLQTFDFLTIPEKCVWIDKKEFYCAIPNAFPYKAVMPDDYLRGEVATQDHIISFKLDTQSAALIFSGGAIDITNLTVATKKDYLIFVNRTDGILWRLKLTQ